MVRDEDGHPVRAARLTWYAEDSLSAEVACSDVRGRFRLARDLQAEGMLLRIEAPGFASRRLFFSDLPKKSIRVGLKRSRPWSVTVRGQAGERLAGVRVTAHIDDLASLDVAVLGPDYMVISGVTDAHGVWKLPHAPVGRVRALFLRHEEHATCYWRSVADVDAGELAPAFRPHRIDGPASILLGAAAVETFLVLQRGRRVVGTVRAPDGAPVVGASLMVARAITSELLMPEVMRTNEQGRYAVRLVPPTIAFVLVDGSAGAQPYDSAILDVPEGEGPHEHDISLGRTITVMGRVVNERGAPIQGARVWATAGSAGGIHEFFWRLRLGGPRTLTDACGRYVLSGIRAADPRDPPLQASLLPALSATAPGLTSRDRIFLLPTGRPRERVEDLVLIPRRTR